MGNVKLFTFLTRTYKGDYKMQTGIWELTKEKLERFNFDDPLKFKDAIDILLNIDRNLAVLTKLNSITKGFIARSVTIGTTPTLIISSPRAKGILILNPALSAGLTNSGTLLALAARAAGTYTTEASPLGVANFLTARLFLNITANATPLALTVSAESRDQTALNWVLTQADVFAGQNAVFAVNTPNYYASLGELGVDVELALRATVGAGAGTITFGVNYTLKNGIAGTSTGVATTIYLNASDGVSSVSGWPLLSGEKLPLLVNENTELWGVALGAGQEIRVFELS